MKRIWTASPSSSQDMLDSSDFTESSMAKRMRQAMTPGELRLESDLQQLPNYGWSVVNDRRWMWRQGSVLMEKTNDPLRLLMTFPQQYQVWIQLPRLYPHTVRTVLLFGENGATAISHLTCSGIYVFLIGSYCAESSASDDTEHSCQSRRAAAAGRDDSSGCVGLPELVADSTVGRLVAIFNSGTASVRSFSAEG